MKSLLIVKKYLGFFFRTLTCSSVNFLVLTKSLLIRIFIITLFVIITELNFAFISEKLLVKVSKKNCDIF